MARSDDSSDYGTRSKGVTCMAERLRVRTGRKPSYREHDEDEGEEEEEYMNGNRRKYKEKSGNDSNRLHRTTRSEGDDKFVMGSQRVWNVGTFPKCPEQVPTKQCLETDYTAESPTMCKMHPLGDVEKILDCQTRPRDGSTSDSATARSVKHYLVKFKSMSYLHCSWVPYDEIEKAYKVYPGLRTRISNFHRQMDSMNSSDEDWVPVRPEWTTVDRVIASRWNGDTKEYLVKWKELSYEDCTWEAEDDISAFHTEIEKYLELKVREKSLTQRKRKGTAFDGRDAKRRRKDFEQYDQTPKFLTGGSLHQYQLEGLNFLRYSWAKGTHVILADEMGLGKTVQSIAFLASLSEENVTNPHLVVAPLSTLRNWEREFATWAPHMNVVMYVGSAQARAVIRQYEFFFPKKDTPKKKKNKRKSASSSKANKQEIIKFDVLLTSYEMVNMDMSALKKFKWETMIIDEGHRLKNKDSKLFQTLKQFAAKHRVLLTGTPLQNNLDELFMLMHFLDAGKFASLEEFQEEFKDISQEEQVLRLHKMLAPHLLRRVKKDVIKDLPPKKELILRVELSSLQKDYYKAILTRNYQILARKGASQVSLTNVVMELRKVCAHPYMLEGVEPMTTNKHEAFRQLLEASGKLYLLDKMMIKLKNLGHRVLIYSQFKNMLDILEDYLIYKNWSYERIDGSISGVERQIRIDRFNAPNSTKFCFILSTRAGGLGINLATADTVIIYDSDWNPHADLQAMARAHRLGQTNKVMIFRLVNRGTIDERMMEMTKKKMILEHVVVGRMKSTVLNQEELDDILRYGAKELFAEENDEASKSRQIHYDDAAIDRLLDRSQVVNEDTVAEDEEENGFLKAFKVANFEYLDEEEVEAAKAEEAKKQGKVDSQYGPTTAAERAQYWDELLKDKYEEQQIETFSELGKGKRCRKQVVCAEEDDLAGLEDISSDEDEEDREADWVETEASASGRGTADAYGRRASRKRARVLPINPMEPPPLMEGEGKLLKVLGFTQSQRASFVQLLMRFGLGESCWSEFSQRMKQKTPEEIKMYGTLFLTHIAEDITDKPTFTDGVPKEGLRIQDVLVRLAILHLIRDKVRLLVEKPGKSLFRKDIYGKFPALTNSRFWKEEHDGKLLKAILKHGYGRWHAVAEDQENGLQEVIRQELQIPAFNVSAYTVASNVENGITFAVENKGAFAQDSYTKIVEGQEMSSMAENAPSAVSDGGDGVAMQGHEKGHPNLSQATEAFMHYRDVQRRLVDFIRKRVTLLEKALNAEYHMQAIAEQKEAHFSNEEPEQEGEVENAVKSGQLHVETENQTQTPNSSTDQPIKEIKHMHQPKMETSSSTQSRIGSVTITQIHMESQLATKPQEVAAVANQSQNEPGNGYQSQSETAAVNQTEMKSASANNSQAGTAHLTQLQVETTKQNLQSKTLPLKHLQKETGITNSQALSFIAPEEWLTQPVDNESNRQELVRMYNKMCKMLNENEKEVSIRSLRHYAEQVQNVLKGQQASKSTAHSDEQLQKGKGISRDAVLGVHGNHAPVCQKSDAKSEFQNEYAHTEIRGGGPAAIDKQGLPSTAEISSNCSISEVGHESGGCDDTQDLLNTSSKGASNATTTGKDDKSEGAIEAPKRDKDSAVIILDD